MEKEYHFSLTIALYFLQIVLSNTTKYNFIPFHVWRPDWQKCLQNFVISYGTSPRNRPILYVTLGENQGTVCDLFCSDVLSWQDRD